MSKNLPPAPRPKARHLLVRDLRRGDQVDQIFLVENSNFKQTRNNKYFIQSDLRDSSGSIKAIRWEADRGLFDSFGVDDFVRVSGRVEEFQQHLQIIVDDICKVAETDVDIEAFLPACGKDIGELERELERVVASLRDTHLQRLLSAFLADPEVRDGLRRCPAGKTLHHATIGGLLDHITSLARAAELLCANYPRLRRDLLLSGVVLHDIGKLRELSFSRGFRYTDIGELVGHIGLGIVWVSEKAKALGDFPPALLTQLLHLIASHHGEPDFGAIKPPMTQEAVALHYLDNIDAKLAMLEVVQREQNLGADSGDHWSAWHPSFGRRLFFP